MSTVFAKDPGSSLDYRLDWAGLISEVQSEVISVSSWTPAPVEAGGLTVDANSNTDVDASVTLSGDRKVVGGIKEDGEWINPLLCRHKFEYGDSFIFETTGGGGWGNPHDRTPEEVLEDVIDEYISVEHARDLYGVSVDKAARKINEAETKTLRGAA